MNNSAGLSFPGPRSESAGRHTPNSADHTWQSMPSGVAGNAPGAPGSAQAGAAPITVILPIGPSESLLNLGCALDPIIAVRNFVPEKFRLQIRSRDGAAVRLSDGILMPAEAPIDAPRPAGCAEISFWKDDHQLAPLEILARSFEVIQDCCGEVVAQRVAHKLSLSASVSKRLGLSGSEDPIPATRDPRVAEAVRRMHASISSPATAASLARALGLSPRRLEGLFRDEFGMGPGAYALEIRLNAAREALLGGRESIADIAARTGFSSAGTFARAFRRRFGTSPTDLRRQSRIEAAQQRDAQRSREAVLG